MPRKKNTADDISAPRDSEQSHATMGLPPSARQRSPLAVVVSTRRQTPEEERQTESALQIFLMEIVRQHLQGQRNGDD